MPVVTCPLHGPSVASAAPAHRIIHGSHIQSTNTKSICIHGVLHLHSRRARARARIAGSHGPSRKIIKDRSLPPLRASSCSLPLLFIFEICPLGSFRRKAGLEIPGPATLRALSLSSLSAASISPVLLVRCCSTQANVIGVIGRYDHVGLPPVVGRSRAARPGV